MSEERRLTEYERYLRVPELLSLQKPPEERSIHEELHFQAVHQVEELQMKMALADLDRAGALMGEGRALRASHYLRRVAYLEKLLTQQLGVLEFLSPHEYYTIRAQLGRGSGQESPGFNLLIAALATVWSRFEGLLRAREVSLRDVYEKRDELEDLYTLAEAMVDVDEGFQSFRAQHVLLVKRIIGVGTPSLKGKPTELLERSMRTQFFEPLWKVREAIFDHFTPGPPLGDKESSGGGHGVY